MSEDGGPAFPADPDRHAYSGMSLRDYFAGQALVGLFAESAHPKSSGIGPEELPATASLAYQAADAMLAEREPTEEER